MAHLYVRRKEYILEGMKSDVIAKSYYIMQLTMMCERGKKKKGVITINRPVVWFKFTLRTCDLKSVILPT